MFSIENVLDRLSPQYEEDDSGDDHDDDGDNDGDHQIMLGSTDVKVSDGCCIS